MKKYLLLPALLLSLFLYAFDKGTWTGYISDSHCGAKGNSDDHASCAKKCVKDGYDPVFVVGDKVYKITDTKKVAKYVGDKVTITGTITDDKIDIEKVSK
jgi:predicted glycosyltransferase